MTSTTSGTATTCPATPTYTYNDASQLTARGRLHHRLVLRPGGQRDRRRPGVRHRPHR
ncbi:hypothetical protein [Streptomyces niveus]